MEALTELRNQLVKGPSVSAEFSTESTKSTKSKEAAIEVDAPPNVTLTDVANAAGVSLAAASRALNGKEGVRDHVRKRVHLVAESLGYRPNRAAKNLAGGNASVMGFFLGIDNLWNNVYGAALLQAVANASVAHDEGLMLVADSREPSKAVLNMINDGSIDGVIISAVALDDSWVEELLDAKVPTVLVGAHPRRVDVPVVDVQNLTPSKEVVGHMLDTGCERVATVCGNMSRVDAVRRLHGYRHAHLERGIPIDNDLIFDGDFSREHGWNIADRVLAAKPDGVFCANDQMALGLYDALVDRGISIPDEISIAGFDGTSSVEFRGPALTTVAQPFDQLANRAIETLKALVAKEATEVEHLVEPEIVWGETTRPRSSEMS